MEGKPCDDESVLMDLYVYVCAVSVWRRICVYLRGTLGDDVKLLSHGGKVHLRTELAGVGGQRGGAGGRRCTLPGDAQCLMQVMRNLNWLS